jgi:hypothetical protein
MYKNIVNINKLPSDVTNYVFEYVIQCCCCEKYDIICDQKSCDTCCRYWCHDCVMTNKYIKIKYDKIKKINICNYCEHVDIACKIIWHSFTFFDCHKYVEYIFAT